MTDERDVEALAGEVARLETRNGELVEEVRLLRAADGARVEQVERLQERLRSALADLARLEHRPAPDSWMERELDAMRRGIMPWRMRG